MDVFRPGQDASTDVISGSLANRMLNRGKGHLHVPHVLRPTRVLQLRIRFSRDIAEQCRHDSLVVAMSDNSEIRLTASYPRTVIRCGPSDPVTLSP